MESLTKIDNCAPYKTHENGKMWQCFYKRGNFGREAAAIGGQAAIRPARPASRGTCRATVVKPG